MTLETPISNERIRVLVADADAKRLRAVVSMVEETGCETRGVTSAAACMDATTAWRPDIVMPFETLRDPDGRGLCDRLKEEPACHDIYVIRVFGSEKTASSRGTARGVVPDDDLAYPFPLRELEGRLRVASRFLATAQEVREVQEQNRLVLEHIHTGVVTIDPTTLTILDANETAAELVGLPLEELIGKPCQPFFCDGNGDACPVLAAETPYFSGKSLITQANGNRIPVLKTVEEVRIGGRLRILDCFVDLRDQEHQMREAREREDLLHTMMGAALDAIICMEPCGAITSWNAAAEGMFGWSKEEVLGKDLHDLIAPPKYHAAYRRGIAEFSRSGRGPAVGKTLELTALHRDGHEFPVEISLSGVRRGGDWHAIGIVRDISARKEAQQKLNETLLEQQSIFDVSLVGILVLENRIITRMNRRMTEMLGYTPEELLGDGPRKLHLSLENYEEFGKNYYWRLAEKQIVHLEYPLRHKDGHTVWCLFNGRAIDPPDLSKGAVWTIEDITDRKRNEEKLRETRDHLQRVLNTAATAVFTADADNIVTSVNREFCDLTGYTPAEMIGRACGILKCRPCMTGLGLLDRNRPGPIFRTQSRIRTKDGRLLTILKNADVVRDESGKVVQRIESFIDVTELVAAREQAEAAARVKAEFLANMSHEIRTPMNGVIGMVGLLQGTELTDEQREYAERISASAESLLMIIDDILDFSKIEAGKLDLETLDFDLRTTIDEMNDILAPRAQNKGLEYISYLDPQAPHLLKGDPGRLRQVLVNLVGNAVKFTDSGEITVTVRPEREDDDSVVLKFEVTDTGIGVPADRLDGLFDSFTQADASMSRRFGGTGLGLSISKQLVTMMQGRIGAESGEGKGSTFWFTARFEKQPSGAAAEPAIPSDLCRRLVLVVDDNESNRFVLHKQLESWGIPHGEAVDGPSALKCLRKAADDGRPYDIAVLDCRMPGMDGETLGRRIKSDDKIKNTDLIMMTSVGRRGDAARMKEVGFAAYLTKPVKQSQFFDCLACVVSSATESRKAPDRPILTQYSLAGQRPASTHVLVVEDNVTNQLVVIGVLRKHGFRADAVENGLEAIRALETVPYDIVLMDIQMPQLDGFETTRRIRDPGSGVLNHSIPIIAMTAHAMVGDREKCLAAGMDDYITKPVRPKILLKTIERWFPRGEDGKERNLSEIEQPAPSNTDTADFDSHHLRNRLGNDEQSICEVLRAFLADASSEIETLERSINDADALSLCRHGHKLKGAAREVGANGVAQTAEAIERAGNMEELDSAESLFPELRERFERCEELIREALADKRKF